MFCHKCGAQIAEDAAFCHNCGTKIVYEDAAPKTPDTHIAEPLQETSTAPKATTDGNDFKVFVDNHIRATTKFQSAEELLNSQVSLQLLWICLGISIVPGILGLPLLAITIPFGYLAAYIIYAIKKGKYAFKYSGKIVENVDTDSMVQFLNTHIDYLQPHFHEWGYIQRNALSLRGAVQESVANSMRETMQETSICTYFGEDQRRLSVLVIKLDPLEHDSGKKKYFANAENRIEGPSFLSHDMGFQKYKCVVKTAPILQAAMEYYLRNYKQN